jgi:DHA1 family tetracycline resistance protein-like MFS transporter
LGGVRTAIAGMVAGPFSYLLFAFAPSTAVMVAGIMVGAIGGLSFPAMQSLMTVRVEENQQGELQGAIGSAIGLTAIIGPPIMTGIFGAYADAQGLYFPGAPFVFSAGLIGVALAILTFTLTRHARNG